MQLTAIGFLDSVFEDDGERKRTAPSRRVYGAEDEASFPGIATTAIDKTTAQVNAVDDSEKEERSFGQVEFTVGEFGPAVDEILNASSLRDRPAVNSLRHCVGVQPI